METTYIGIDCGLDGGISFLREDLLSYPLPTLALGKGRTLDVNTFQARFLRSTATHGGKRLFSVIEDPGPHAMSAAGLRSMTRSFAQIETILILEGIPYVAVLSKKWQSEFWTRPKMAKGSKFNTKAQALAVVTKLWPAMDWRNPNKPKSTKPHDGMTDSALLAEWGRRKNL